MVDHSNSEDLISSLDLGNPLHLQNSDFSSNTMISVKLSGIENYRIWVTVMKLAINTRSKTGFIDEVWAELKETYDKLDGSIIFNLLQKIHGFKQGELTVFEYYYKLNSLWREFDIMTKLPKCSCATREDVLKHNQLMQFLMGLNEVFQPIRISLLSRETLSDVKDAFAIISKEESHRGIASSSYGLVFKPQVFSFVAKSNNWTNNGNKKVDNKKYEILSILVTTNVLILTCFVKIMGRLGILLTDALIGYPPGYNKNPCPKQNGSETVNANSASTSNENVGYPNESCVSLLSVNKLIKDSRLFVGFTELKCYVQDLHHNKIMGTGSENGGLYLFDSPSPISFSCQTIGNQAVTCYVSKSLWHNRLGYPSDQQNGVAERKHRHMLNVARSLLPSSVLNGKSPFELVYGLKPKPSHLRSFGCLYFSYVLNNSDKFSASPNDDGRVNFTPNDEGNVYPCTRSTQTSDGSEDNIATSMGSSRKYGLEKYVSYSNMSTPNMYFSTNLNKSFEPNTFYKALKDTRWVEAINNEIEALNRNNTWTICDRSKGRKPIGYKWLFKIKYKSTCEVERYKATLVAKSFSQREEFDYLETFSPGVKMATSKVCKLNKSLYGLKQALRQWNAKLTKALVDNGFVQSKFDYSLFTKKYDDVFIALLVYVDDIVITGNNLSEIEKFKLFLKSKFQIKDLEKLKYFLGIKFLDNKDGICLSQRKYCLELLHEYGMLDARHVDTPLPENTTLNHVETDDDHLLKNVGNYQRLVGKLIYLTNTRPDISYFVHCLSQYRHSPPESHLDAALRTLRYLKGSPGSGIQINKNGNLKLRAYADSSVEAEYRSMASATCKVIWLSNLLGDMGVKSLLHVVLYCDTSYALKIAANPVFHEKTKHFEIDVHLVREKFASGVIKTEKIHTTQQIDDVTTKALDIEQHKILCEKLRLLDMFKMEKLEGGC
ncbi:ribonuclease H-like domain-containing protein [Tanacetum coccineum]